MNPRVRVVSRQCKGSRFRAGTKVDDAAGRDAQRGIRGAPRRGQYGGAQSCVEVK